MIEHRTGANVGHGGNRVVRFGATSFCILQRTMKRSSMENLGIYLANHERSLLFGKS